MRAELLAQPLRYADGELHLPDGPGLGVELDPSAVRELTRRS
jgi:muconate cycloisomerase